MCILIFKKYWIKDLPDHEELKNCYEWNKDGIWVWIADWERNYIYKYDNFEEFMKFYKTIETYKNLKTLSIMIHFRYRTSGPINKQLNHPYLLSQRDDKIKNVWITQTPIVWHNGVLQMEDYTNNDKENDTMFFIKNYLSTPGIRKNLNDKGVKKLLENYISWNKILVLYPNHKYTLLNKELWHYKNNLWYSNYNYSNPVKHYHFWKNKTETALKWLWWLNA